jgi:hypothetical protein
VFHANVQRLRERKANVASNGFYHVRITYFPLSFQPALS